MCLGVPGKLLKRTETEPPLGNVAFGAVEREVCLAYTPDAKPGDYLIVHAGFAISVLDAEEAAATLLELRALEPAAESEPR